MAKQVKDNRENVRKFRVVSWISEKNVVPLTSGRASSYTRQSMNKLFCPRLHEPSIVELWPCAAGALPAR